MKRRSLFSGSRKGKVPLPYVPAFRRRFAAMAGQANCGQSEPNAFADLQSIIEDAPFMLGRGQPPAGADIG